VYKIFSRLIKESGRILNIDIHHIDITFLDLTYIAF